MTTKHNFIFLIDGSGSMSCQPGENPLRLFMQSLSAADFAAKISGAFNVAGAFFGPDSGAVWHAPYNLQDPRTLKRLSAGLVCGSSLSPAVKDVQKLTAQNSVHLVVACDDLIYDIEKSEAELSALLKNSPASTLDAVVIGGPDNRIENMMVRLKKSSPAQVGIISTHPLTGMRDNAFTDVLTQRLKTPPAGKAPRAGQIL